MKRLSQWHVDTIRAMANSAHDAGWFLVAKTLKYAAKQLQYELDRERKRKK